jgi:hypothetical protein
MGRSTPVRALYCSKCKAKWSYMYARSNYQKARKAPSFRAVMDSAEGKAFPTT